MTKLIDVCKLAKHWGQSVTASTPDGRMYLQKNLTTERLDRLKAAGRVREGVGDHTAFQSDLEKLKDGGNLDDLRYQKLAQGWASNYLRFIWKSTGGSQPLYNFMQWAFIIEDGGILVKEVLMLTAGESTHKVTWCTIKWDGKDFKFDYLGDPSRLGVQMG